MSQNDNKPDASNTSDDDAPKPTGTPSQGAGPNMPEKPTGPPNTDFRTLWIDRSRDVKVDKDG